MTKSTAKTVTPLIAAGKAEYRQSSQTLSTEEMVKRLWDHIFGQPAFIIGEDVKVIEIPAHVDRDEYEAAIRALACGDHGVALNNYMQRGGRIPTDEN